jgi:hypothetical protein
MIKLNKKSLNLVKQEFEKGNIYQLLTQKGKVKEEIIFTIVNGVCEEGIYYKDYTIQNGYIECDDSCTPIRDWNWSGYDFYILNKEEASKYLKELIVKQLTNPTQ